MATPAPITVFYASLIALGCVPCPACDGDFMLPDHVEHRPRIPIWQPIPEAIPETIPEPIAEAALVTTADAGETF